MCVGLGQGSERLRLCSAVEVVEGVGLQQNERQYLWAQM